MCCRKRTPKEKKDDRHSIYGKTGLTGVYTFIVVFLAVKDLLLLIRLCVREERYTRKIYAHAI
jgi:hypothetical protein